jgi:hypothetical protein
MVERDNENLKWKIVVRTGERSNSHAERVLIAILVKVGRLAEVTRVIGRRKSGIKVEF